MRAFVHTVAPDEEGLRLDEVASRWLSGEMERALSKSAVRKLVMAGAVRVDGRPARKPGLPLRSGQALEARIDARKIRSASPAPDETPDLQILYEDDDLIAVAKPAGLLMHATADSRRADLFNALRRQLALPYLGLHHRLDVETSGVVLFTRRERANAALARQFAGNEVTKVYHAIVAVPSARVPPRWRVDDRLAMVGGGRRARMQHVEAGGVEAVTDFAVLERFRAALLVEARPHTGRKHQIRAHLAGSRMPVIGDARYGGAARAGACAAPRVMLHAREISLQHPITGRPLTIACPYPPDFARTLDCLRQGRASSAPAR